MKKIKVQDFVNRIQETEIDIKVENGRIAKCYAKGTSGSIAFIFTDLYARLMIGIFGKTNAESTLKTMNKIQENAIARVKEYFEDKKSREKKHDLFNQSSKNSPL